MKTLVVTAGLAQSLLFRPRFQRSGRRIRRLELSERPADRRI